MTAAEPTPSRRLVQITGAAGFAAMLVATAALIGVMYWGLTKYVVTSSPWYALIVFVTGIAMLSMETWLARPLKFAGDQILRLSSKR